MFVIILWGLTLIATLSEGYMVRSLLIGVVGLLVGTIGMSANGVIRGTFGSPQLLDGVAVIPAMIGMFAASELFSLPRTDIAAAARETKAISLRGSSGGSGNLSRCWEPSPAEGCWAHLSVQCPESGLL